MESSERLTQSAIDAPDLAELMQGAGPYLSLYLNTETEVRAARRSNIRGRRFRSGPSARTPPDALLDEIDRLVPEAHLRGPALLRWSA